MKKFFTLFLFSLLTIGQAWAQNDNTFQFIDKDGNALPSGTTLTVGQLTEDVFLGNFIATGLSVQNVSDAQASLRISYQIETLDNGMFQICFPSNCITKTITGSFETTKGEMAAGEVRDLQCEWFPDTYGTCKATLGIEVLNGIGGKIADGPAVTVVFNYQDPSGIGQVTTAIVSPAERYNLSGQRIMSGQRGMYVVRMEDGSFRKIIKR